MDSLPQALRKIMIGSLFQRIFHCPASDDDQYPDPCYRLAQLLALQAHQQNARRILFGTPPGQSKEIPKGSDHSDDAVPKTSFSAPEPIDDDCERCGTLHFEGHRLIPVWFQKGFNGPWVPSQPLPFTLLPKVTQAFQEHGADLLRELGDPKLHVHLTVTEEFQFAVEIEQHHS